MKITLFQEIKSAFKLSQDKPCFINKQGDITTRREFLTSIENIHNNLLEEFPNTSLYKKRIVVNTSSIQDYLAITYTLNALGSTIVPVFSQDSKYIKNIYDKTNAFAYITDNNTLILSKSYNTVFTDQLFSPTLNNLPIIEKYNQEAMVIYTSGTTGVPKGVILGNASISHVTSFMNKYMQVDSSISEMVIAPLDHAFGFGRCHSVLKAGGNLFIGSNKPDIRLMISALDEKKINAISIMPSLLTQIMKVVRVPLENVSSNLKWLQTGAMKFKLEDKNTLCDIFPGTTICMHFGMSESMRTTFINLNKEPTKRHTEGRPSEGTEVVIMDESGSILPPNTEGRLAMKGKSLALGYIDQDYWKDSLYNDWFMSNDIALLDENGYLHYRGRNDDIINLNGLLIHPDEVEVKLKPILGDVNFSIAGISDPRGVRDRVIALFIEGVEDKMINVEYISKQWDDIERHMIPSYIFWMEEFPRTKTGKVIRSKLNEVVIS